MGKYADDPKIEVRVNMQKARELTETVTGMMYEKHPPFDKNDLFPDAIVPEGVRLGSRKHGFFLFYGCSIDSMTQADNIYSTLRAFSNEASLSQLYKVGKSKLEALLRKYEINTRIQNPVRTIYENSRKLKTEYDNDPRKIFSGFPDAQTASDEEIQETLRKLGEFTQFRNYSHFNMGVGKAALLTKNLVRFKIWPFPPSRIPIKVDRHVIRISIPNLVEFYSDDRPVDHSEVKQIRAERLIPLLTQAFLNITRETETSAIDLDDGLWAIGSQLCHQNKLSVCWDKCKVGCPYRPHSDQTTTVFHPSKGDKRRGKDQRFLFD